MIFSSECSSRQFNPSREMSRKTLKRIRALEVFGTAHEIRSSRTLDHPWPSPQLFGPVFLFLAFASNRKVAAFIESAGDLEVLRFSITPGRPSTRRCESQCTETNGDF